MVCRQRGSAAQGHFCTKRPFLLPKAPSRLTDMAYDREALALPTADSFPSGQEGLHSLQTLGLPLSFAMGMFCAQLIMLGTAPLSPAWASLPHTLPHTLPHHGRRAEPTSIPPSVLETSRKKVQTGVGEAWGRSPQSITMETPIHRVINQVPSFCFHK